MKRLLLVAVLIFAVFAAKDIISGRSPLASLGGPATMVNRFPPSSPLYAQQQYLVDRFNAEPALRKRFAGIVASKGLYAEMQTALRRGAGSLGEQRITAMFKAMSAVVPRLPPQSCAKLLVPRDDFDEELGEDLRRALEVLPPVQHKRITDFYLDALLAEVHDLPIKSASPEAREYALQALSTTYHGAEAERITRVLQAPKSTSVEDRCWAAGTMLLAMSQLSPDNAVTMARIMWSPQG